MQIAELIPHFFVAALVKEWAHLFLFYICTLKSFLQTWHWWFYIRGLQRLQSWYQGKLHVCEINLPALHLALCCTYSHNVVVVYLPLFYVCNRKLSVVNHFIKYDELSLFFFHYLFFSLTLVRTEDGGWKTEWAG